MVKKRVKLADIILKNPGCVLVLDNDCWWINTAKGKQIASSEDEYPDDGGHPAHLYGQGVLCALASLHGMAVEGC